MKTALIIGKGRVGNALGSQLLGLGWRTNFITPQDVTYWSKIQNAIRASDIVCLTISTKDDGSNAFHYLQMALHENKPVATAEKAALANFFPELSPNLHRIGFSATVGGGSGILSLITKQDVQVSRVCGIINGTFNFLGSRLSARRRIDNTLKEACKKGLCESQATSLNVVMMTELEDLKLKSSIVFHLCNPGSSVKASDFSYSLLSEDRITRLFRSPKHRLMLHLEMGGSHRFNDSNDLLFFRDNRCTLHCGFTEIEKTPFTRRRLPRNEENALFVDYCDPSLGRAFTKGIGAGPVPTAAIMVKDILRLTA